MMIGMTGMIVTIRSMMLKKIDNYYEGYNSGEDDTDAKLMATTVLPEIFLTT
jgi:hypothetical protein